MVSQQVNLRLPPKLLADAKRESKRRGYRNVQAFVEQTIRDEIYDDIELTAAGRAKLERALRDVAEGRTVPGDVVLAKMRRLASGKR